MVMIDVGPGDIFPVMHLSEEKNSLAPAEILEKAIQSLEAPNSDNRKQKRSLPVFLTDDIENNPDEDKAG